MALTTLSQPVLIANTMPGPTVFTDDQGLAKTDVKWEGVGDSMGGDIQAIPSSFLENPKFLDALNKGILAIHSGPQEIIDALSAHLDSLPFQTQAAAWKSRQALTSESQMETIDYHANNDYLSVPCIGPSAKGPGECGEGVPVKAVQVGEKPALCVKHAALASQYIPSESDQIVDGKAVKIWTRAAYTAPQHS